ncbi:MAG: hypothetical protein Q7S40_16095 [Opitutaceae bacterium]|nr:hypothetical protein [Opitutaceae bacterium]
MPRSVAVSEPSLVTGEKKSYAYSWQQEVQMGAEADKELVQEMGLYENPALQSYVQAVGERMVAHSSFANPSSPPNQYPSQYPSTSYPQSYPPSGSSYPSTRPQFPQPGSSSTTYPQQQPQPPPSTGPNWPR